jgi:hypothetical protein
MWRGGRRLGLSVAALLSGGSLAGVRLVLPDQVLGLPVLRALPLFTCHHHYPGTATGCFICSLPQSCQPSPKWQSGRPVHRPFRGLLDVHSRYGLHTRSCHQFGARYTEGFNRFVTSAVAPVASGWSICRVGLPPTGKAPPFTSHARSGRWSTRTARSIPRTDNSAGFAASQYAQGCYSTAHKARSIVLGAKVVRSGSFGAQLFGQP